MPKRKHTSSTNKGSGQVEAHGPEVVARGEHDLVATRFERGAFEQGLVAAAVVVGDAANDLAALAVEAVERQRDAGAGLAMCGIEYMCGESSHCCVLLRMRCDPV